MVGLDALTVAYGVYNVIMFGLLLWVRRRCPQCVSRRVRAVLVVAWCAGGLYMLVSTPDNVFGGGSMRFLALMYWLLMLVIAVLPAAILSPDQLIGPPEKEK